ncbi:MBL fold metallo-hydrolase [Marinagarivorans cellulosilyticus]|uniref:Metallo-beta-lactamase domain-containing protein n=1 Tax=Marinagarivorans cellulosilyticus TaxID=2721545 RepID=A0AAN2BJK6_9GAMM|nr:MBL fold metallo-hydrolase [Marinagarivorans cellulosilyticus]BCD97039.1 hypothetical protein MARGE09_P1239 [Marinagarivorans cellulosilyticus]
MRKDVLSDVVVYWCKVSKGRYVNYCWIVENPLTREAVIIDPAWEMDKIQHVLLENSLTLKAVLITHHHHDHIDLAKPLAQAYGCDLWISRKERDFYCLENYFFKVFDAHHKLRCAGMTVEPIVTPGHTAGSTCFKIGNAVFTGDTLFNEGCGMCVGPGSSSVDLYQSLQMLHSQLNDDVHIYPGHKYSIELGQTWKFVKSTNIYLNIRDMNKFVEFRGRSASTKNAFSFV